MFNQPVEQEGQVLIAVVDETYGVSDDEGWEIARECHRRRLEEEFGLPFEDADIGPGASLPAFVTFLHANTAVLNWVMLAAAFFLGKPLKDNLEAWATMADRVRSFFRRPVYLNRQGAAVLAVESVLNEMGGLAKTIRLIGYQSLQPRVDDDTVSAPETIEPAPDTLLLGYVRHVFHIEADGQSFVVSVEGRDTIVTPLEAGMARPLSDERGTS